ncbi:ABC transporter [Microbacterium sp. W1N]|uniref:ABC transporter n=1 Tax=Microbacterium festucae TaxID=2977531 RepID=UPI0021C19FDB|nr:ABC transporter [Microbacterium festucae]MCT9819108.1 ABC transporter [Microbacterium festucae]
MSDHKNGEPVPESTSTDAGAGVDDVVSSAHAGLADAEAASRDAVRDEPAPVVRDETVTDAPTDTTVAPVTAEPVVAPPVTTEPAADRAADRAYDERPADAPVAAETVAAPVVDEPTAVYEPSHTAEAAYAGSSGDLDPAIYGAGAGLAGAGVGAAAVTPSEPAIASTPQPIFVQAPEAPRLRGNRGAAGAIGLLAALSFGVLYLIAALVLRVVDGDATTADLGAEALSAVTSWWFWVPVAVFFLAFWLLGAIINRGRWGSWVIFGLLVGVAAYGGHLLGQLFQAQFWTLTASQGADLVQDQLLAPLAVIAFVLGREITIWFGAWAAARGKRVTELNVEARREYERTLEAGPQLHRL